MKTAKAEGGANKAKRQSLDRWREDKMPYKGQGIVIRRENFKIRGRRHQQEGKEKYIIWGKNGAKNT